MTWIMVSSISVSVPVLSKAMVFASAVCSIAAPFFTIIPCLAARLIPEMIAIGAARISGHGVATTMTSRKRMLWWLKTQAKIAIVKAITVKGMLYLSARRTNGDWLLEAACTNRTICSYWLSVAGRNALALTALSSTTEPLNSLSPTFLSSGALSPVMLDSSKLDSFSTITQSTGTTSPGFIINVAPVWIVETLTSVSFRPFIKWAFSGAFLSRIFSSVLARFSAKFSSISPPVNIITMTIATQYCFMTTAEIMVAVANISMP